MVLKNTSQTQVTVRTIVLALWCFALVFWHAYLIFSAFTNYPSIHAAFFGTGDVRGLLSIDILVAELVVFAPLVAILTLWRRR
ncbi:MAG: hypothetical protein P4L57_15520 [Rhizomicrobium sp.]|nr:hypothetical protein [Rhizomicrobium sp.]